MIDIERENIMLLCSKVEKERKRKEKKRKEKKRKEKVKQ
jgi:hypothetical protein